MATSNNSNDSTSSSTKKPHILVVGLAAVDFVAQVDHFPTPDEKMRSSHLLVEGGGNAANTACAIGRLQDFCDCSLVTAVGDDANGTTIVDGLLKMNVNVDHVERYPGSSPFTYILCADVDNDNTRTCIHQPSTGKLSIDFVTNKISLPSYTAVHFDVRYPTAAVALAKRCVAEGIPYSVDVERPREGLLDLLQNASIVICNSNYCNTILEGSETNDNDKNLDAAQKLRKVMKMQAPKAKLAVQTLGSKGSILISMDGTFAQNDEVPKELELGNETDELGVPTVSLLEGRVISCPTFGGCKVVDTTGAGDAFQGGFLAAIWYYMANSNNKNQGIRAISPDGLGRALRIASRVAGKKIEQPGARSGLPIGAEDGFLQMEFPSLLES